MNDNAKVSGKSGTAIDSDLFSNLKVAGELGADPQIVRPEGDEEMYVYIVIGGLGLLESAPVPEASLAEVGPNAGLDELLQTRQKANRT